MWSYFSVCICVCDLSVNFLSKSQSKENNILFYMFGSTVIGFNQELNYNCYTLLLLNIVLRIRAVLSPDIESFSPKDRTFTVENVTWESWHSHISRPRISSTHFPNNPTKESFLVKSYQRTTLSFHPKVDSLLYIFHQTSYEHVSHGKVEVWDIRSIALTWSYHSTVTVTLRIKLSFSDGIKKK